MAVVTTVFDTIQPRQRIAQNFLLIWIDANVDASKPNYQHTLTQLRSIVNEVCIFSQRDEAIDFITELENTKAFVIVTESIAQHILPLVDNIPQIDTIYILWENNIHQAEWIIHSSKVKSERKDITSICESLQLTEKQCHQDSISISFIAMDDEISNMNLNQLDFSYIYTQIFKEILFETKNDEKAIKDLADYCREFYNGNIKELNIINEFEHNYRLKSPVWWYARECFLYQMLNRALQTLECETLIKMSFFIRDLHQQIGRLHQKQLGIYGEKSFIVYRGQGLLKKNFKNLRKCHGYFMSFNNFLSTTKEREISLCFARCASKKSNMVGILFKITVDPTVSSTAFAITRGLSYYITEEEVLFSMHTIFRVGQIILMDKHNSLYQVDLHLTFDDDRQRHMLTECIRKKGGNETGWQRLGVFLLKLNQLDKAEQLYNVLLERTSDDDDEIAFYYNNLGSIKNAQGVYQMAIKYYEKAKQIWQKILFLNHPLLTTCYSSLGRVYNIIGEYSKALWFYEKALEIRRKTLRPNHPLLATSYNNIGGVYDNMGDYSKALDFYEKALNILQQTLPENHSYLAVFYNNIGGIYDNMKDYSKAFSLHGKALGIQQKTLPSNHPDLAQSYNNIGFIYMNKGEYLQALWFYERALGIRQKTLPPDHPELATFYNNIGAVYRNMNEYSKALSFYEQTRTILENTLPSTHPLLASCYNNIAWVYRDNGDYLKALSYYQRALDIKQQFLPIDHPSIRDVRRSIETIINIL